MDTLKRVVIIVVCCLTGSVPLANESRSLCGEGWLYSGLEGSGQTTAIEVIQPLPPLGEQLGDFDTLLIRSDCKDCKRHQNMHSARKVIRWQGVVRGRQTFDGGMHHALANSHGQGYVFTSDFADSPPLGECEINGAQGLLIRETLVVDEGIWDGQIISGQFVVNVCFPQDLYVGSKIKFEIADGTELCLTPEDEAE